jgi:glycosyltransferase involved in cell wall biosynthesis
MVKILIIISEAPPIKSGVSRVANEMSRGLRARGFHVDILSQKDIPRFERGEIRLSSMPLRLKAIRKHAQQYDIVNLHGPVPSFSDVFLLSGLQGLDEHRPNLIYTHHAPIDLKIPFLAPAISLYNNLQERLANLADHVVVSTPSYGQKLSRFVPTSKLSVIPWGVNYDKYQDQESKEETFTVLYLGQIRPYKGLPVLLKAASELQGVNLWVVGDGHYANECRRQAEKLGLENTIFWGNISDKDTISLVKKAHAIVLPSVTRSEAFGIALLEGMAAGLVPVASHIPGVSDLIGNEGFTFQPGNSKDLISILIRLRDDKALRVHMAELAQAKARIYSWERSVFGYERIIMSLLRQKSIRSANAVQVEIPTTPAR